MANKRVFFMVGARFKPPLTYTPNLSLAPATLDDVEVKSQIRTADGTLVADLVYEQTDDTHFTLEAVDGTADWLSDNDLNNGDCVEWNIAFSSTQTGVFMTEVVDLVLVRSPTHVTA